MKITVIGSGYVGLVSGICFAKLGHDVICVDKIEGKILQLKNGEIPIFEPGLKDLLKDVLQIKKINFTTDLKFGVENSDAIFIAVGTPQSEDGNADLSYVLEAARQIAIFANCEKLIVTKSTVPAKTGEKIKKLVKEINPKINFLIASNPEFLREGSALDDFMNPDRIVIGFDDEKAKKMLHEIYQKFPSEKIVETDIITAELIKYSSNSFLATKISFINEIARLCDATSADIEEVRKGISSDKRIGGHFLYPGPGYGGSCFPKDVKALIATAEDFGMDLKIVNATEEVNDEQKSYVFQKIEKYYGKNLTGKTFTFWGVAFKANTDDVRETAAISMARKLIGAGATINIFDPVATENYLQLMREFKECEGKIKSFDDKYEALNGSDALITVTEWREFATPDFAQIKARLKKPVIFDGRNLYDTRKILDEGFEYFAIGKFIAR